MSKILPLKGKYYGTYIEATLPSGSFTLDVWFMGNGVPSSRQLKADDATIENWASGGYYCDSHYETADCYTVAVAIKGALDQLERDA